MILKHGKILVSMIVITVMVLTLLLPIHAAVAKETLSGKVNLSLSEDGKNLLENLKDAELNLDSLSIDNTTASFSGSVSYQGKSYKINAQGSIGKGKLVDAGILGNLQDKENNFKVAYFTIEDNANSDRLFLSKENKQLKVLKIYLLRNNTRELVMFEQTYSKIKNKGIFNINCNINKVKDAESCADYWFYGIFNTQEQEPVSALSTTQGSDYYLFTESVSVGSSTWITYNARVDLLSTVSTVDNGQAQQFSKQTVTFWTDSNSSAYRMNDAPYRIYNTRVTSVCGTGDLLLSQDWTGRASGLSTGLSVYLNVGFTFPGTPISANVSWTPDWGLSSDCGGSWVPLSSNQAGKYARIAGMPFIGTLNWNLDYYAYAVTVGAINGDSGNRNMDFYWTFDFYKKSIYIPWQYNYARSGWNRTVVAYH